MRAELGQDNKYALVPGLSTLLVNTTTPVPVVYVLGFCTAGELILEEKNKLRNVKHTRASLNKIKMCNGPVHSHSIQK